MEWALLPILRNILGQVYFPLNKRACLRLRRGVAPAAFEISEFDLGHINRATMINASHCLYSAEGYRRISRLFDQWGCKIEPGKNAFMPTPETKAVIAPPLIPVSVEPGRWSRSGLAKKACRSHGSRFVPDEHDPKAGTIACLGKRYRVFVHKAPSNGSSTKRHKK